MSLFLVSQHSFFFKDSFFPSFLTHHHQTATKTCFIPPKKKKKNSSSHSAFGSQAEADTPIGFKVTSSTPRTVTAWRCFLPHIPGTKPHRTVRSTKAQFSPKLYSQAFLPDELGRKSGNRSGDTCACV